MRLHSRALGPNYQCQVRDHRPSLQACGAKADEIYVCEQIGPHDRHKVGEHTILHALNGNGYSCEAIERLRDRQN